jgi:hypothetical protein
MFKSKGIERSFINIKIAELDILKNSKIVDRFL